MVGARRCMNLEYTWLSTSNISSNIPECCQVDSHVTLQVLSEFGMRTRTGWNLLSTTD